MVFSLHRVESWRAMYKDISLLEDKKSFAGELLPSCLSVVQGKVKELDCFYLARQVHNERYLLPHAFDWITNPTWLPSYQAFHDCLSTELAREDKISMEEAKEVVTQAFWSYLAQSIIMQWQALHGKAGHSRLRRVIRAIPSVRRGWRIVRSLNPNGSGRLLLPGLLRPSSPYHADFMPIYHAACTPPKETYVNAVS